MDYDKLLKRAWQMVKSYRALWVFGVILALTTLSLSSTVFWRGAENDDKVPSRVLLNYKHGGNARPYEEGDLILNVNPPDEYSITEVKTATAGGLEFRTHDIEPVAVYAVITLALILAAAVLFWIFAAPVARYVAEVASIRMVDDYEETGQQRSVRSGFRMGWGHAAWRLFLIDLVAFTALILGTVALFIPAVFSALLAVSGNALATAVGIFGAAILALTALAATVVAWVGGIVAVRLARRACVLEGLGVVPSIYRGYGIVRGHLKELAPVWLITVGVELAWSLLTVPVLIVLLILGVVLGGVVALGVGALASLAWGGATPWIVGAVVGLPLLILILAVPLTFLGGLREAFLSSTWTLTYRELGPLTRPERIHSPELSPSGLGAATAG